MHWVISISMCSCLRTLTIFAGADEPPELLEPPLDDHPPLDPPEPPPPPPPKKNADASRDSETHRAITTNTYNRYFGMIKNIWRTI